MRLIFFILFFTPSLFADEVCFFQSCSVLEGALSVCSGSKSGTAEEMLKDEKASRGQGQLYMRECTKTGKTELGWTGGAGMFTKDKR